MLLQVLDELERMNINCGAILSNHMSDYKHFAIIPGIPKGFSNH